MRKVKISLIVVIVLLLLGFASAKGRNSILGSGSNICSASIALAAPISSEPITNWASLKDPEYDFTVEYPAVWNVKATIDQASSGYDPEAILKRYTFVGTEGIIDLDVWLSNGMELSQWLEWYGKTRDQLPITAPNAKVAGLPSVMFVENGVTIKMLTTFWGDDQYVFRLRFTITHYDVGLQVYHHLLDTISLSGKKVTSVEFPDDVWKDAQRAVEESSVVSPLVNQCCGFTSPGNPFPCCRVNGQDRGNCTWWVYYQYGGVPFRGDAGTWWSQVPDYPDWRRGSSPHIGQNIAWWSGSPGHVAFVPNYTGGVNVTITEMMWCTSCRRTRTIPATNPSGYMWTIYTK